MNGDTLIKGLTIVVAGAFTVSIIKDIRQRRLQKEMYEQVEVIDDESQNQK